MTTLADRPAATFVVEPAFAARLLVPAAVLVAVLSLGAALADLELGADWLQRLNAEHEGTVPAWAQSALLLCAAALWLVFARRELHAGRPVLVWCVLAGVFALASVDEIIAAHEEVTEPLRDALDADGLLHFAWVLPGAALAVAVAVIVAGPVLGLPRGVRGRIVLAGALYLGGTLGVELVAGALSDAQGEDTLGYVLVTQLEEALEMAGATLLVIALLELLARPAPPEADALAARRVIAPAA